MTTLHIPTGTPYDVHIGAGLLPSLGEQMRALCPKAVRTVLVTDDNVFPLHGEKALASLRSAELEAHVYVLPHGEASKTPENLVRLLEYMAGAHMTRSDALVALGGGVVGDLTGFAAACYMRGIAYIQCPTTLLAAVDSSVGGKTAVDLSAGKNLMGAFWQPGAVLCDTDTLETLPEAVFADGCAEVVKTAMLFDRALLDELIRDGTAFSRERVIARCVSHKRDVVAADERDTGRRALLNLGHTLGHAVEAASGFAISHGRAVAIGTAAVTRSAAAEGLCEPSLAALCETALSRFGLPVETEYTMDELLPAMLSDKKRAGDTVNVIVPEAPGRAVMRPMDETALRRFYEKGLKR